MSSVSWYFTKLNRQPRIVDDGVESEAMLWCLRIKVHLAFLAGVTSGSWYSTMSVVEIKVTCSWAS
jgi:hypothetical protein